LVNADRGAACGKTEFFCFRFVLKKQRQQQQKGEQKKKEERTKQHK